MSYQHKRSSVVGKVPVAADFKEGQILVNIADGALYLLDAGGTVRRFDNRAVIDTLLADKLDKTATAANSLQLGGETAAQWQAKADAKAGVYTGSAANEANFPIGHTICVYVGSSRPALNAIVIPKINGTTEYSTAGSGATLTGVWRSRATASFNGGNYFMLAERAE